MSQEGRGVGEVAKVAGKGVDLVAQGVGDSGAKEGGDSEGMGDSVVKEGDSQAAGREGGG